MYIANFSFQYSGICFAKYLNSQSSEGIYGLMDIHNLCLTYNYAYHIVGCCFFSPLFNTEIFLPVTSILYGIGAVTSVIIFPLGIIVILIHRFGHKNAGMEKKWCPKIV